MITIENKKEVISYKESRKVRIKKLVEKSSKAKTLERWLNVKIQQAYEEGDTETEIILKGVKTKLKEFQKIGIGVEQSWRGKSGIIEVIKEPDKVIIYRMKKPNKGESPAKVAIEITRDEINACLTVLGKLQIGDYIESKQIFMGMSRILELGHTSWDYGDKPFETDRKSHNKFTTLLCFLENEKLIEYSRRGKVKLINNKISIQTILEE